MQLFVDTLAVEPDDDEDELSEKDLQLRQDLNSVLNTLPPRERNVIRMRYGLVNDGRIMTFQGIGQVCSAAHINTMKSLTCCQRLLASRLMCCSRAHL